MEFLFKSRASVSTALDFIIFGVFDSLDAVKVKQKCTVSPDVCE
jgi:hypothetical protein